MSSTAHSPIALPRPTRTAKGSESGIWIALFAITMSFAAFTSALFIRQASTDWTHIAAPPILFASTAVLLLSSLLMELSRRKFDGKPTSRIKEGGKGLMFLAATLVFGFAFVGGQYLAWRKLATQGLYLATNPNSSFFYLLTGVHALHVLGGIAALAYLIAQLAARGSVRRNLLNGVVVYWHFMAALWLYLLVVICVRL
ncbi:MAG TPA: cytochrome c oxidase subunit 3 [Candidatus Acidoferrum sp.]|nr:cytochrome c oxidase subunit 3 [Candidatus Acidoferrum sp.]